MSTGQKLSMAATMLGAAAWEALIVTVCIVALHNVDTSSNRLAVIGGCLFWGGPIAALVGLGLGIAGAVNHNPNKPAVIAGVALPGGALVGAVVFFAVAAYAVLTLLSNQP